MQQAQSEIFLNMKYTLDFVDELQILKDKMNNSYIDSMLKWCLGNIDLKKIIKTSIIVLKTFKMFLNLKCGY